MKAKRCCRCKETKPTSEFCKNKSQKDGLHFYCKACRAEDRRRYYEANKEKELEATRRWRKANKEKVAERDRKYYEANKEKRAETKHRWYLNNKRQVTRDSCKRRKRDNELSLELAYRQGLPWEDWEDEFVMADNGLSHYQKSVKLERSLYSVMSRRANLRKKARNELTHDNVRV